MKKNNSKAFTLIELVISIGIVLIITSAVIAIAKPSDTFKLLTLSRSQLVSIIRLAQTNSLTSGRDSGNQNEHVCAYEVAKVSDSRYVLNYYYVDDESFKRNPSICSTLDSTNKDTFGVEEMESYTLLEGVSFDDLGGEVYFKNPYGKTNGGSFKLSSKDSRGRTKEINIEINSAGKIE